MARHASNIGITLLLVFALAFFARDLVPPGLAERLAGRVGLGELAWLISSGVERSPGSNAPAPARLEERSGSVGTDTGTRGAGEDKPATDEPGLVDSSGSPMEPEQSFVIQFPSDSDLLDYDAWITLDRAAALLRGQPDLYALIAYKSDQSMDKLSSRELARVRIAAVESYLVTAGVDPARLRQEIFTASDDDQRTETHTGRFIMIAIGNVAAR